MSTLLRIDSSPMQNSISRELTSAYVDAWKALNAGGSVTNRNLADKPAPPIDQNWIGAAYTPEDAQSSEQRALLALSE
jgi:FMN-dependent NADH-azoreductase